MEVLTKQESLESIIFTCILAGITSLVVNLILNADICLEIVGEFIGFIKRKKESVHFWIWQKTHKELSQEILSKEPTYELPGKTADEWTALLESWARAAEPSGKRYLEEIESWAEFVAYAYSEREE